MFQKVGCFLLSATSPDPAAFAAKNGLSGFDGSELISCNDLVCPRKGCPDFDVGCQATHGEVDERVDAEVKL